MYELRKWHKNSRNGSILSSVYLAEVKAVAFAVISSGYRSQALLYTNSDQRYIRRYGIHDPTQHYLYPCWVRVDLYTAGDETTLQILGQPLLYAYHGCTPRGVSILRIPLVALCSYLFCLLSLAAMAKARWNPTVKRLDLLLTSVTDMLMHLPVSFYTSFRDLTHASIDCQHLYLVSMFAILPTFLSVGWVGT